MEVDQTIVSFDSDFDYVTKMHNIIFAEPNFMNSVMNYLEELNRINPKIFDCVFDRLVSKNSDDEFEYTGRIFEGLILSDTKYDLKITKPVSTIKEPRDTDLNARIHFEEYTNRDDFKELCCEIYRAISSDDHVFIHDEIHRFSLNVFYCSQQTERLGNGSNPTVWDIFWNNLAKTKPNTQEMQKMLIDLKTYFKIDLCLCITATISNAAKHAAAISALSETNIDQKEEPRPKSLEYRFRKRLSWSERTKK